MTRLTMFVSLIALIAAPVLGAQQIQLQDAPEAFSIAAPFSDQARTVIQYEINAFERDAVSIQGREYAVISLGRRATTMEAGLPSLPILRESIVIPDDARMSLRVLAAEYVDLPGIDVAPSKGHFSRNIDPAMVEYRFDDFYGRDAWYPETLAALDEPYIMRDTRGIVVELDPFQYNPATHTLRVYTAVTLEVVAEGPGGVNVLAQRPERRVDEFESIYARHYLNYASPNGGDRYVPVGEAGGILVISYDAFVPNMQPYVQWKLQKGVETRIVPGSQAGATYTQIASYIQSQYNAWHPAYVLLVGDAAQLPRHQGGSDPCYSLVAGGDSYPDLFVGRFSAETAAQVTTQVERSVEYERDWGAQAWPQVGTGIASNQGPGDDGEYDYQHMNNIRTDLLGYGYNAVDQIYDPSGTAQMVSNALNEGRGIVNYCGHGSMTSWGTTGFSNTHVNNLVNDNKLPFICSVACNNGTFDSGTCFAEAWLRASHNGEPTGAVGTYMSYISQSWNPPMIAQDEAIDLLVQNEKRTLGGLWFNGSCQMIDESGGGGITEFKNWMIFGDPALSVRTKTAQAMDVSHAGVVIPGEPTFTVTVSGVAGALCALYDDGVLFGSALTNGAGVATITMSDPPEGPDDVTLTVTAYNKITHVEAIPVGIPLVPSCDVEPGAFNELIVTPLTVVRDLFISNFGDEGSVLDYSIRLRCNDGFGGAPTWLHMNQYAGTVNWGDTDQLQLTFTTAGLADGTYECDIVITSNAPAPVTVPVVMVITSDPTAAGETPRVLALSQNHPNPFNPKTSIRFALPEAGQVSLAVYDAAGALVRILADGQRPAGYHEVSWDGRDASGNLMGSGVYFYRLETAAERMTRKMLLVK